MKFSGTSLSLYPAIVYFGVLWLNEDECVEIPLRFPFKGEWGKTNSYNLSQNEIDGLPSRIQMAWVSLCEGRAYYIDQELDNELFRVEIKKAKCNRISYTHILVGMSLFGGIALWLFGGDISTYCFWLKGHEINLPIECFTEDSEITFQQYCQSYVERESDVYDNLVNNGLPSADYFDKIMRQYKYRLKYEFMNWCDNKWEPIRMIDQTIKFPMINKVKLRRIDGSFDKTGKYAYQEFNLQGRPELVETNWNIGKTIYNMYLWFDREAMERLFNKYFGSHLETPMELIFRIDYDITKLELLLFHQGLKEPAHISEHYYQYIVFKNQFECRRSENFNQKSGSWIW